MLCEYQRPHESIVTKRVFTSQTGYSDKLYSVDTLPEKFVDHVEDVFFRRVDQDASDALNVFLNNRTPIPNKLRDGWSRFIMSLMQRHPGKIDEMWGRAAKVYREQLETCRADYPNLRRPEDPEDFDEFRLINEADNIGLIFLNAIQTACDMSSAGDHINKMEQTVYTVTPAHDRFMTSDNPLTISAGLARPDCRIMLPISPRNLFIATNTKELMATTLTHLDRGDLVNQINAQVISQAYRFVYGICENKVEQVDAFWPRTQPVSFGHLVEPPEGSPQTAA